MADYELELPGKLTIEVDEDSGEALDASTTGAGDGASARQGIFEGAKRRPYLTRRAASATVTIYDLGTRLLSSPGEHPPSYMRPFDETTSPVPGDTLVDEYVEPELWYNLTATGLAAGVSPADRAAYYREILGSLAGGGDTLDPTGETPANKSGRKVSNSVQFQKDGDITYPSAFGLAFGSTVYDANSPEWKKISPLPIDGERWNSQNMLDHLAQHEARLTIPKPSARQFSFAGDLYHSFDTSGGDGAYKVTEEASYTAEVKVFRLAFPLKIYAVPAPVRFDNGVNGYAEGLGRLLTETVLDRTETVVIPDSEGHPVTWEIKYYTWFEGACFASTSIVEEGKYFITRSPVFPGIFSGGDPQAALQAIFDRNVARGASKRVTRTIERLRARSKFKWTMRVSFLYPLLLTRELVLNERINTTETVDADALGTIPSLAAEARAEVETFVNANSNRDRSITGFMPGERHLQLLNLAHVYAGDLAGVVKSGDKLYYIWFNREG